VAHTDGMRISRTIVGAGVLAVEVGLAVLGVVVQYGFTAEYGNITDSPLEGFRWGFSTGIGAVALALVGVVAVVAVLVSSKLGPRLVAVAIPVLMVAGMLAITPFALRHKLELQYNATPQCLSSEDSGFGPGSRAMHRSQQAFESFEHVGHFGGGGGTGVGGCDRSFILTNDVDVLQHYRSALPEAGWRVVEDDGHRLRAERGGMAFEVVICGRTDGVVWAGRVGQSGEARCRR